MGTSMGHVFKLLIDGSAIVATIPRQLGMSYVKKQVDCELESDHGFCFSYGLELLPCLPPKVSDNPLSRREPFPPTLVLLSIFSWQQELI